MRKNYLLIWQEGKKDSRKKNEIDSDDQNKGKKKRKSTKYDKAEDEMLQDDYKPCDYYL